MLFPVLYSVYLFINQDTLSFVTTDTYRVTVYSLNLSQEEKREKETEPKPEKIQLILPFSAMKFIRTLKLDNQLILISFDSKTFQIEFTEPPACFITQLITSEEYPVYQHLFRSQNPYFWTLPVEPFYQAIHRLNRLHTKYLKRITLLASEDSTLTVSVVNNEIGNGKEILPILHANQPSESNLRKIDLNGFFLEQYLKTIRKTEEEVTVTCFMEIYSTPQFLLPQSLVVDQTLRISTGVTSRVTRGRAHRLAMP